MITNNIRTYEVHIPIHSNLVLSYVDSHPDIKFWINFKFNGKKYIKGFQGIYRVIRLKMDDYSNILIRFNRKYGIKA